MASNKHTHKYIKQVIAYAKVWMCALPNCNHWMPPHYENLLIGKNSICWGCSEMFVLDEDAMKEDMPRCVKCRAPEIEEFDLDDLIIQKRLKEITSKD